MKHLLNMKGKKTSWTLILLILYIATVVVAATLVAPTAISSPGPDQPASLEVTPKTTVAAVGETFVIDVNVSVTDPPGPGTGMVGFGYKLKWNDILLSLVSIQYHYPPKWNFEVENVTFDSNANGLNDTHSLSLTGLPVAPFTGVMSLCTYNFTVMGLGGSTLDIYDDILVDDKATEIPHETVDGYFSNISPIPIFTYSPDRPIANERVTFDASDSYSPVNNTLDNYTWDFGDGNITGTAEAVITHTYTAFGSYIVNLTITDNQTNTGTTVETVTVRGYPEAFFIVQTPQPIVGVLIRFNPNAKPNGGTIVKYEWSFGDGKTKTTFKYDIVNNTYATFGIYNISLTVTDSEDLLDTYWRTIKILAKPVANFSYSPAKPTADETITFDASASHDPDGSIVSYFWKFGDGTNGTDKTTTHTYSVLGTYDVTLTVTDNDTLTSALKQLVGVKLVSSISISASPTTVAVGKNTTISGSITPVMAEVNVTMYYRLTGETVWKKIATVLTDENSQYSHSWMPPKKGTYEVKASWLGDATHHSAESSIETIKVQEAAPPYILYVVIIVVIVIAAGIAIYFLRFRKS